MTQTSPIFKKIILGAISVVASGTIWFFLSTNAPTTITKPLTAPNRGTDQLIARLEKEQTNKGVSFIGQISLSRAYLQKMRETADPSLYATIEKFVEQAEKIEPANPEVIAVRALIALSRHQFKTALALGKKTLQANPDNTSYYGLIADAQIELGQYPQAIETIQTMVDRRPDFDSFTRIAYARELYGDIAGAIEAMQSALAAGAAFPENTAWAHAELGRLYTNSSQPKLAAEQYTAALAVIPDFAPALRGLGYNALTNAQTTTAKTYFDQAATALPTPEHVTNQADWHATYGDAFKAEQIYELVEIIYAEAEKKGVNSNLEFSLFLADHDRKPAEALQRAKTSYLERQSVHGADVLAWALYKNKQFTEAKKYSQTALSLNGGDPAMLFHASKIAAALGESVESAKYLAQIRATNPYFSILHSKEITSVK